MFYTDEFKMSTQDAYLELIKFAQRRGEAALHLAMHAAVPQGFRLDLLNLLRVNFLPDAPRNHTVESYIIHTEFCHNLGGGLYEFDPEAKRLLLNALARAESPLGLTRVNEVADFLISYVEHQEKIGRQGQPEYWWDYLEMQRWVALSFRDPDSAAEQLAAHLNAADERGDGVAKVHIGGLASALSLPLMQHQALIDYLQGVQLLEQGELETGQEILQSLGDAPIQIGNVVLPSPVVASHLATKRVSSVRQVRSDPYVAGMPVREKAIYIEREADHIAKQAFLASGEKGGIAFSVTGPRRIGRTSLGFQVGKYFQESIGKSVFIDLQSFSAQDLSSVMLSISHQIARALRIDTELIHLGERSALLSDASFWATEYLEEYVLKRITGPLLIVFDELDMVLSNDYSDTFFTILRSWAVTTRVNLLLLSITRPNEYIKGNLVSPFNVAKELSLENFTLEHVRELNERGGSTLTRAQIERVFDLTGGQPLLAQALLFESVLRLNNDGSVVIDQVMPYIIIKYNTYFLYLYDLLLRYDLWNSMLEILKYGRCSYERDLDRLLDIEIVQRGGQDNTLSCKGLLIDSYFRENYQEEIAAFRDVTKVTTLPPDTITRVKPIILPYVRDKDEREALLIESFYLRDPRPLDIINLEGSPDVFLTRLIAKLIQFGCLALEGEATHSLAALLLTIRARSSVETYAEIDRWVEILNDQCTKPEAPQPTATPFDGPPQSVDTPREERRASVFITYSHSDEAFAQRLRADLESAGHACWIDTSMIKGGADWQRAISDGINNSYAFVVICSNRSLQSEWVLDEIQWARTRRKMIITILLEDVTNDDRFFGLHRYQSIRFDTVPYPQALNALITALPAPPSVDTQPRSPTRREHELAYLDRLRFEDSRLERFELAEYAPLAGVARAQKGSSDSWASISMGMKQEYALTKQRDRDDVEPRAFSDAVGEILALRRVVILGEPGSGKTQTLRAIAKPLYTTALSDPAAPIPLMIRLGKWVEPEMPFETFMREELGELGAYLDELFTEKRAALLLDGLDQLPASQKQRKYLDLERFVKAQPDIMVVVTCREANYTVDLRLSQVLIRPLDQLRIRDFAMRALGDTARGSEFFNLLSRDQQLLQLARNPYMLRMLLDIFIQFKGTLPENRGQLFSQFVNVLLTRERLAQSSANTRQFAPTNEGNALLHGLQQLAYEIQVRGESSRDSGTSTSLSLASVRSILNERLLYLAQATSLLNVGDHVSFTSQLMQEYFAASYLDTAIKSGRLKATDIWKPERWWERTNWEEAVIILAGLYSDDCTPVLDWVSDANPEVASRCILYSGAHTPDATRIRLRDKWIALLTKSDVRGRAAVGRALAVVGDPRSGVGIRSDGIPDLAWIQIPAGEFISQDDQRAVLPSLFMSIYPITYIQYQTFVDAPDGYTNPQWWDGVLPQERQRSLSQQYFQYANHPRENVSFYQAIAFCRWLSTKLSFEVRPPTEAEWEYAVRGSDGRRYPYVGKFDPVKANVESTEINMTSSVGIFPEGASPFGVLDMSGNVWEHCLNEYDNPDQIEVRSTARRVIRGGSWQSGSRDATVTTRRAVETDFASNDIGFRVVRALKK